MFVGTIEGIILVMENDVIIRNFTTVCGFISSMMIDTYGNMLVLSFSNSFVYLYHTNGSNLGNSVSTSAHPTFMNFDLNGRLVITSWSDFEIYYWFEIV
jgi:hypothetical protein